MEGRKIVEDDMAKSHIRNVGVAVSGRKQSKSILRWALQNLTLEGNVAFKLIHVNPIVHKVPTPMGNFIPISQVRPEVAAAFKKEVEWKTDEMLLPYKRWCAYKNVEVDVIIIESDDVADAISEMVDRYAIDRLVIGTSATSNSARKQKLNLSMKISESAPGFCMVLSICEGILSAVRPPNLENNASYNNRDGSSTSASLSGPGSQIGMGKCYEIRHL